jgi:tetratricopeptide (TPR) repeat protein
MAARAREKALAMEREGDTALALLWWDALAAFDPQDLEAARRAGELAARENSLAEGYYQSGLSLSASGNIPGARRAFLSALRHNPDHADALRRLRFLGARPVDTEITAAPGDTFASLSAKHYGGPGMAPIIALYNRMSADARPAPGTRLFLPWLQGIRKKTPSTDPMGKLIEDVGAAQKLLEGGQYGEAAGAADKALEKDPKNTGAARVRNIALYQEAMRLKAEGKYAEALSLLDKMGGSYGLVEKARRDIQNLMR